MATLPTNESTRTEGGQCIVCNAPVTLTMRRDGGIVLVDATGYSGLTDDGDSFVCRDHYCSVCGGTHADAEQFDACAHYGVEEVDMTPPCSIDFANAVLGRTA